MSTKATMLVSAQQKVLKAEQMFESHSFRCQLHSHSAFKSCDSSTSQEGVQFATGSGDLFWPSGPCCATGRSRTWMPARLLLGQGSPQADSLPLLQSDRKENTPGERRLQRASPLPWCEPRAANSKASRGQEIKHTGRRQAKYEGNRSDQGCFSTLRKMTVMINGDTWHQCLGGHRELWGLWQTGAILCPL